MSKNHPILLSFPLQEQNIYLIMMENPVEGHDEIFISGRDKCFNIKKFWSFQVVKSAPSWRITHI